MSNHRVRKRLFRPILQGSREFTFNPPIPDITLGTVADDWHSVGRDLRDAMNQMDPCDQGVWTKSERHT
jgi:hypothetical protein